MTDLGIPGRTQTDGSGRPSSGLPSLTLEFKDSYCEALTLPRGFSVCFIHPASLVPGSQWLGQPHLDGVRAPHPSLADPGSSLIPLTPER